MEQVVLCRPCILSLPCGMHRDHPRIFLGFLSAAPQLLTDQSLSKVHILALQHCLSTVAPSQVEGAQAGCKGLTSRQLALAEGVLADEVL